MTTRSDADLGAHPDSGRAAGYSELNRGRRARTAPRPSAGRPRSACRSSNPPPNELKPEPCDDPPRVGFSDVLSCRFQESLHRVRTTVQVRIVDQIHRFYPACPAVELDPLGMLKVLTASNRSANPDTSAAVLPGQIKRTGATASTATPPSKRLTAQPGHGRHRGRHPSAGSDLQTFRPGTSGMGRTATSRLTRASSSTRRSTNSSGRHRQQLVRSQLWTVLRHSVCCHAADQYTILTSSLLYSHEEQPQI